ncbi:MAG TPA: hypothetical protein VJ810_04515 [Blastocatellia bacterium]|nr:hypothetical protein [Blastocatellia bacterium]
MKNSKSKLMTGVKSLCGLALLLVTFAVTSQAQVPIGQPWTSIGAVGTVDEGDVTFTGPIVYLEGESAVLRYNVVSVDGVLENAGGGALTRTFLRARFRDNGDNNRVIVRLKSQGLVGANAGDITTLMTIDSNDYPGSSSFQTRSIWCDGGAFSFDFVNNAYYVEVTMTRTTLPVTAGLAGIQVGRTASACIVAPTI